MPKQGTGAEPLKDVVFDGKRESVVENCISIFYRSFIFYSIIGIDVKIIKLY